MPFPKVTYPTDPTGPDELPLADAADLCAALEVAAQGFALWRTSSAQQRAAVLNGAARLMLKRQEDLARVATPEQGKTLAEARIEVLMNAGLFQFYAGKVQRLYGRALVRPTSMRSTVCHEPVGQVAAFAPWHFPLGNPGRKLGAPVAAGCSVILEAAEETPAIALGVLQCLLDAGLPPQVAQAVFGVPDEVSRYLLGSPVIRKLSFTGSTQVGKHLARLAADDMKRTTMEPGGHGPVALINRFADGDAMIAEANRLPYGVAAQAWCQGHATRARVAAEVETGMLGINTTMIGGADAPFGGVKWSGHGHEDGSEGLMACLVTKTVHEA